MVKVFFNNSCNICRAEINHYKKHSDNSVEWIDVTNNEEAQKVTSKSYKELLRRMHVIQDGIPSCITCILLKSSLYDFEVTF